MDNREYSEYHTVTRVARILGVSGKTVLRGIREGKIPARWITSKKVVIPRQYLENEDWAVGVVKEWKNNFQAQIDELKRKIELYRSEIRGNRE